ncbi:MAG: tetratricopeptide repeat protein [Proteobacteria bacterium]|nr:tetratricopeptide repeat protein [Pseudomonadota bacterium]
MNAELSLQQQFAKAAGFYEKGKLDKAGKIFRDIQRNSPNIPEVLHMLALIALKKGRADDAVDHLEAAVKAAPKAADLFGLLGGALKKAGRPKDAAKAFEQAITLDPGQAETHYNLGNALRDLGRDDNAVVSYRRAIALNPNFADAFNNLGRALADMGSYGEAVSSFLSASAITPGDAETHSDMGNAYREMGRFEDAIDAHRRAIELDPGVAVYWGNLGAALVGIGRTADGADAFRRALAVAPGEAHLHFGLGNALLDQGRIEEAKAAYHRALEIEPENPMANYLLSRPLLLEGDLKLGWGKFAWRWKVPSLRMRDPNLLPQLPWQGQNLNGKTILVWAEQGIGDEIFFANMIPDLLDLGAKVVVECDPRLIALYERSFDGVRCIAKSDPPAEEAENPGIDFQTPVGNLGGWLRADLNSFPSRPGFLNPSYLVADGGRRVSLRNRYQEQGNDFLVGISWHSKGSNGDQKSMTLLDLRPLLETPGITFIDLQYGDTCKERNAFTNETGIEVFHDDGVDQMADLDIFASQVAAMDIVVTISNTTAHMAGALGVPTLLMLGTVPIWYWLLEREDSPWYPSLRLFRQHESRDWQEVVERTRNELSARALILPH